MTLSILFLCGNHARVPQRLLAAMESHGAKLHAAFSQFDTDGHGLTCVPFLHTFTTTYALSPNPTTAPPTP